MKHLQSRPAIFSRPHGAKAEKLGRSAGCGSQARASLGPSTSPWLEVEPCTEGSLPFPREVSALLRTLSGGEAPKREAKRLVRPPPSSACNYGQHRLLLHQRKARRYKHHKSCNNRKVASYTTTHASNAEVPLSGKSVVLRKSPLSKKPKWDPGGKMTVPCLRIAPVDFSGSWQLGAWMAQSLHLLAVWASALLCFQGDGLTRPTSE